MSASRTQRKSELLLQEIWVLLPGLVITLWYPFYDQAFEQLKQLRDKIDVLILQVEKEATEIK